MMDTLSQPMCHEGAARPHPPEESQMGTKSTDRLIRFLSLPVGVAGLCVIAASLQAYYKLLIDAVRDGFSDPLGLLFIIPFNTFSLALGLFAIYTTVKIWTRLTPSRIRTLAAIGAVIFWGVLANFVQYLPPNFQIESQSKWISLTVFGSILLPALFYQATSRWLTAKSSCPQEPPRPVSPNLVGLFCLMLFAGLASLINELAPKEPGIAELPKLPWEFVAFLVPALIAGILYKTILHLSAKRIKRYKQTTRPASTPA